MRSVSYRLADFENKKLVIPIGFVGENEFTKVNIDCQRVFKDHPSAVATLSVVPPSGDDYPAIVTRDGDIVTWEVTASDLVYDGFGEIQLTFTDGTKIGKDYKARTHIEDSIAGSGTAPTPVQNWIDSANEKLAAVEEATQEAEDAASHPPRVGSTGYWEIWDVETEQYVATSTKAQGEDGSPGHSPVITANKNGKTTVLYSDGQQIAQIVDGNDGNPGDPTTLIDDTAGTGVTNKTLSADKITTEFGSVLNNIQGLDEEINGGTEYTEETWSGTLEAGRYNKSGVYTATNDYRSATVDMTGVVQMKITATDAAGVGNALVIYLNSEDTVIGSAFDCDGTRKTYTQQVVENFPTGTAKAIVVHYRGTFDNPTIVLKKAQVTAGLKDAVEAMATDVETLDGQINGTTSQETVTWTGELEKGRYDKQGNYTATNDYRSATVDMANVLSMKVTATDAAGVGYALVVYKNAQGTVIGSAYDCDGTRKTYTEQEINTFPEGTAFAIIVHYRGTFDNPTIVLTKTVETAGIAEDVDDLKDLTDGKFTMEGKKIVCFGDSIFGMKTAPNDIPSFLEKYLGATAYNCGFSGAWMADRQSQTGYNAFSLNHLIDSVVDGDFTEQENAFVITPDLPSTYRTNLTTLEGIDFSTVDIVTIAFGTNDFMSAIPYENQNDNHDVTTVFGSLRHCIEALLTEYPNIRIFVMGQTYRFWMDGQGVFDYDSNTYERGDHTKLTDMVELTKAVAKEYNLPFIDNYKDLGICRYNRTQYFPSNDGTHHNENGVILLARHIAHELY